MLLSACGGGSKTSSAIEGEILPLKYAENLTLIQGEGYTEARLRNPWDTTSILRTYILVDKDKEVPDHLPEGTLVRTPLSKALVYTATHCNLIHELGAVKSIGGICEIQHIKVPEIVEGCKNGTIVNAGEGTNPDIEKIIDLHPDALLLSPYENSGGHGQVEKLKIPIIECADYMETSALGSAEWIRFYGLLFGREALADSIFAEVEKNYNEWKALATAQPVKPRLMCEVKSGSAWYVSGGRSTTGKLYADDGADYAERTEHTINTHTCFPLVIVPHIGTDVVLNNIPEGAYEVIYVPENTHKPYILIHEIKYHKENHIYGIGIYLLTLHGHIKETEIVW